MILLLKLAWRNLKRHSRKSLLLSFLITFGIAILFLANSIFLGTNSGMEKTFVGSFTGNASIVSKTDSAISLFGNEIPIVSNLDTIPPLLEHNQVIDLLKKVPEVDSVTSIVSVTIAMTIGGINKPIAFFGIDPDSYVKVCHDIKIVKGNIHQLSQKGVFFNSVMAKDLETALKRPLQIGEPVTFTLYSNNSFRIRTAPFQGIFQYPGTTEALNRVVLGDLTTVRSMANYTLGSSNGAGTSDTSDTSDTSGDSSSLDNLFSKDTDVSQPSSNSFDLNNFEKNLADTSQRDAMVRTDKGAWSFILVKAVEGKSGQMFRKIAKVLKQNKLSVDLLSWRRAAGSTALIIFALQAVFYLGLGFLGLGAVLVIMNALVFSVLERSGEIGTMRSMGATPGFIRSLFMMESLIITVGGAILGIFIGIALTLVLKSSHIHLSNKLLVSLFGGNSINLVFTLGSIVSHLFIALVIGGLAWIYPVSLAMKIQPVTAMNRG